MVLWMASDLKSWEMELVFMEVGMLEIWCFNLVSTMRRLSLDLLGSINGLAAACATAVLL